jgi:hypothetical protein
MDKTTIPPGQKRLHYKDREKLISQKDKEISKLKAEILTLKTRLEYFTGRNKSKVRKEVVSDEKVISLFSEFFEQCLKRRTIDHPRLKELEAKIENPSDHKVLYFFLQQTIIPGREFTIVTEKEIIEGKKIGYMVITTGTGLSDKTVRLCLDSLEAQGLILRHRKNKLKNVYILNTVRGKEIFAKLENGEYDFADIEHVLMVKGAKL